MRLLNSFYFWILVYLMVSSLASGLSARAATGISHSPEQIKVEIKEDSPDLRAKSKLFTSESTHSFGLQVGYLSGYTISENDTVTPLSLGVVWKLEERFLNWELDANFSTEKSLDIGLHYRWSKITWLSEPDLYVKLGIQNYIYTPDAFAGLINKKHFKVHGSVGMEHFFDDIFYFKNSPYAEIGAGSGESGSEIDIKLGLFF